LLLVLLLCVFPQYFAAESERANLLLQRRLTTPHANLYAQGHQFNVTLSIYNVGNGPAYGVVVVDEWPSSSFSVVSGSLSGEWEEIVGGGQQQLNFTLLPTAIGQFDGIRATVRYSPTLETSTQQKGYTQPIHNFNVIDSQLYTKLTAKHVLEWLIFLSGLFLSVGIPLGLFLFQQSQTENGIPKHLLKPKSS